MKTQWNDISRTSSPPDPSPSRPPRARRSSQRPGAPIIDVKNLSVWYDDFKAVTDVSLPIPEREITAFIGSSGPARRPCCGP